MCLTIGGYMSQKQEILNHLKEYRTIDTKTAIEKFWITRLSAYIKMLRDDGYKIVSNWVTDGKRHWVEYILV